MHDGANQLSGSDSSLVDYNRAGVPLLEVVSEPDMRSGVEAAAYASELRRTMCFMGLTEGIMAQGHMRFDVNVSVSTETKLATAWPLSGCGCRCTSLLHELALLLPVRMSLRALSHARNGGHELLVACR